MAGDGVDLTGEWWGNYSYPGNVGPTTPFIAKISDHGSRIEGTIIEPDVVTGAQTLEASIAGIKHGSGLDFVKTYKLDAPEEYENPVDYVGSVSADGNAISGVWSLYEFDGTFEMFREAAEQTIEEQDVGVSVAVHGILS